MKHHALRRIIQCVSGVILVMICLQIGAVSVRADDLDAIVIWDLNDCGFVTLLEPADDLGFLKGNGIHIATEGYSPGGPKSLAALASGPIGVAGAATPAVISAIARGAEIICVAPRVAPSAYKPSRSRTTYSMSG